MPITGLPYVLDSQLKDDATALEDRLQANFDFLQNNIPSNAQGQLLPVAKTTTYTAAVNDLVIAAAGTFTVTSPGAGAGRQFAVFVGPSAGVVTVAAASGSIFGPGLGAGAGSFALKANGTATLVSDGTNWEVIAGGPSPSGMTFGVGTVTFTASMQSANATITHGLGFTPVSVVCTAVDQGVTIAATTFGATTFVAAGSFAFSPVTGSHNFSWLALG